MKTTKKQNGVKTKLTKGKRVSLRCPLSMDRMDLEYNLESSSVQLRITLDNMGGGGFINDAVESVVIVVRLYDANGVLLTCGGNEYYAKSLRFGEEGLQSGSQVTFRIIPECPMGEKAEDVEAYISRIRFVDGTTADYVKGDFFDLPGNGVLLTKKFKKNTEAALHLLGEGAVYVPEQLTEVVWRCTCGEFSESDVCPACGRNKAELFQVMETLSAPAIFADPSKTPKGVYVQEDDVAQSPADGKTAEYAIGPKIAAAQADLDAGVSNSEEGDASGQPVVGSPAGKQDRTKILLLSAISAAAVVLLVLILILVLSLCSSGDKNIADTTPQGSAQTKPSTADPSEQIVDAYLAANDYDNALGYALQAGMDDAVIQQIYSDAIAYYTQQGNLEKALDFAVRQGNTTAADEIRQKIFEEKLANKDYIGAMAIADELPDDQKEAAKLRAADGYVDSLVEAEQYREAVAAAEQYKTTTTPAQIADAAINSYVAKNEYQQARAFAEEYELTDKIPEIAKKAVTYYLEQQDLPKTMEYLALAGDAEVTKSVYTTLTDAQIRRYLPTFFGYLDFAGKQAVHASPISSQAQAVVVLDEMGNVFLGEEMIYDVSLTNKAAVSVSACDTAVVVLLSDGKVEILASENTHYDQNDVKGWKNIVAISAGNFHLLGLTAEGKVLAVGSNTYGQCKTSTVENAVAISAGGNHSLILLADGTVTALGRNDTGICNTEKWTDIVAISAGALHSIGIKSDGTAVSLGNCDVSEWKNIVAVVSGGSSAVGITADNKLHYTASGKPSNSLIAYENVVWVSVRQNSVALLDANGSLSGIGVVGYPPSGVLINTDVYGMK